MDVKKMVGLGLTVKRILAGFKIILTIFISFVFSVCFILIIRESRIGSPILILDLLYQILQQNCHAIFVTSIIFLVLSYCLGEGMEELSL